MSAFATNRKATFNYDIRSSFEAGIELLGWEVKFRRAGRADLSGSYGIVRIGEIWLVNLDIPLYQPKKWPVSPIHPGRAASSLIKKKLPRSAGNRVRKAVNRPIGALRQRKPA
jgi:SsrA-binding protein